MYYTYMIRCKDQSIYTGITTDIKRRWQEHLKKEEKCAKYTKRHSVLKIETAWETENRILASKLEFHIKKDLTKLKKEKLITGEKQIKDYFDENIIDYKKYEKYK